MKSKTAVTPLKVFLADDHVVIRTGLAHLINSFPDCIVCGQAADGKELMEAFSSGELPDLVILDINMPRMDGFETAHWLRENHPSVKVLVLTMYESDVPIIRLMQKGVRGVMKKDISPEGLREAISSVQKNGYYYCNSSTGKLAAFFDTDENGNSLFQKGFLTPLEIDFLRLTATDMVYKEMTEILGISLRAINAMATSLFNRLGVKTRAGLAVYAIKNGIAHI